MGQNVLSNRYPQKLMTPDMAGEDYALDAQQDRMARVYATDPATTCKKAKGPGTQEWCPPSIPVRAAAVSGHRSGDTLPLGPLYGYWPTRRKTTNGAFQIQVALIKQALCLKLPVCDTKTVF